MILGITASSAASLPVVTGGTLTSDATYYYRTFTANGTLTIENSPIDMTYWVCGGGAGGGTRTYFYPYLWRGYFRQNYCWAGGGGGGGSNVINGSVTYGPQSVTIVLGAGGYTDGTNTSITSTPSINVGAIGYRPYGPIGGGNNVYNGANFSTYGTAYDLAPDPYYYIGGGGAGANGNGSGLNGGAALAIPGMGISLGGGGAAVHGGYDGNDYNPNNFTYYPAYFPDIAGTPGTNGGTGSALGNGGDAPANRGGGGGAGNGNGGQGGSGIAIFRYLRSAVGG